MNKSGLLVAVLLASSPLGVSAQELTPEETAPVSDQAALSVSPGGAFLRAALLPGWGHVDVRKPFAEVSASQLMCSSRAPLRK